jgi:hypothetical protein
MQILRYIICFAILYSAGAPGSTVDRPTLYLPVKCLHSVQVHTSDSFRAVGGVGLLGTTNEVGPSVSDCYASTNYMRTSNPYASITICAPLTLPTDFMRQKETRLVETHAGQTTNVGFCVHQAGTGLRGMPSRSWPRLDGRDTGQVDNLVFCISTSSVLDDDDTYTRLNKCTQQRTRRS